MFTTERLRLRAFREKDGEEYLEMFNDPLVASTLSSAYLAPISRIDGYVREVVEKSIFYATIELKDTAEFVGDCSLRMSWSPKDRDAEFGICIKRKFWNKGYGTEVTRFVVDHAFRMLGVHRVSLVVFESNAGAIVVYKRVGFVEEGRIRKANLINGHWDDRLHMGILVDDWERRSVARDDSEKDKPGRAGGS